jgi:hypothetical protein
MAKLRVKLQVFSWAGEISKDFLEILGGRNQVRFKMTFAALSAQKLVPCRFIEQRSSFTQVHTSPSSTAQCGNSFLSGKRKTNFVALSAVGAATDRARPPRAALLKSKGGAAWATPP